MLSLGSTLYRHSIDKVLGYTFKEFFLVQVKFFIAEFMVTYHIYFRICRQLLGAIFLGSLALRIYVF